MIRILLLLLFVIQCLSGFAQKPSGCRSLLGTESHKYAYPKWSKDGQKILYQSDSGGRWSLMIMDGGKHQVIIGDSSNNYFADWSPDNQWICFVSDRSGNEDIYLAKSDGSELRCIINDSNRDIHPYFSPDGKYILFNSTRGNGSLDIYRYGIADKKTDRLTDSPQDETCARYAPNMQHIVYLKNDHREDDLYLLDLSNFMSSNLSKTPQSTDGWPAYSHDGRWIYYSSMASGTYCIYRIRPDGTELQQVSQANTGEVHARVQISSDNRHILYNVDTKDAIGIWSCDIKP
jgi:TolB protein